VIAMDIGTYGRHQKRPPENRETPDVDAIALAKSKGYFIQRTQRGDRKSYALMKDGAVVNGMRDVRLWEVRQFLEGVK
jgi:hypothetical protein